MSDGIPWPVRMLDRAPHWLLRGAVAPLRFVPGLRRPFRVVRTLKDIERLEDAGADGDAREARHQAIAATEPALTAPLWRSEGWDRLRLGDATGALAAFENGIRHLNDSAALYGVTRPDALYYGAAIAAYKAGQVAAAERYRNDFAGVTKAISQHVIDDDRPSWWSEGLEWLQHCLQSEST